MSVEITIGIATVALTVLALVITILINSGQSIFLYANARIMARIPYIIDKNRISQLIGAGSLADLINHLADTEYYPFLETIDKNNITELNIALEKGLINSINEIKKFTPKKFRKVFDVYAKIYESKIIKTFFRSRFSNVKIPKKLLEPIGTINPVLLKHLHDTQTIADMKLVLRDTDYSDLFEKEYKTIEEFDSALEKQVMGDIDSTLKKIKVYDRKAIMEIFRKRREIKTILMLLKLRIRGIEKSVQKKMVQLPSLNTKKLIEAEDMKKFVEGFSSTEYEKPMKEALIDFEKNDNYFSFEKHLLRHYYTFVKDNDLSHSIGSYPIISYITKKEIEQKNLFIISKGITAGLDKKEIERMII